MAKVLLVDDEQRMLDLLTLYLKPHQFSCKKALGGQEALNYLEHEHFDIVLLDIMMPDMNGWELCQEIRSTSDIPIIMVTAREQQEDIVKGLRLGADDYITKPFHEEELVARINALLRRVQPASEIDINGLRFREDAYELLYRGQFIKLTPIEFKMIGHFMKRPNRVFTREHLIEFIWGFDSDTEGRTVDSHVRNMREKIRQSGFPIDDHLKTVWGIGYKWVDST
ncbi:DNA-binding response OmpR family regulator [Cerasibacillus quisquiliarum]|uniref:DNA-binding response regulator n=1 Tax=Cerasibacillus quisquiliarum TaxID=227865 RepID=A0A511UY50_9BACI|nr:response regulator transcription factor [Cerasibacillus quisquiliarum]MBB5146764.1 DNA-binding response OmpR family regulator [Cerasibacillus quisquiliarum]GEN31564.1 DNA-binding response regulator [Cerasibacillus quisquiliarum]